MFFGIMQNKTSNIKIPKEVTIFLDMDGVLVNFFSTISEMAGVDHYRKISKLKLKSIIHEITGTDFFYHLPKTKHADSIINLILSIKEEYGIISSPLIGDEKNTEFHKKRWIKDNLLKKPFVIHIKKDKKEYAISPEGFRNILIDDRGANITDWEKAGGIGIKFQSDEDHLEKISEGLLRAQDIYEKKIEFVPQKLFSREM